MSVADLLESYAQYRVRLNKPFLDNEPGRNWQSTLGQLQDESLSRLNQAAHGRMPSSTPADGLQYIASERTMEQAIGESETDYREILRTAWTIWAQAGSQYIHQFNLGRMGCGAVSVYRRADLTNVPADPRPYVNAFAHDVWAQFDIILQKPMSWGIRVWDPADSWGTGVWGITISLAQRSQIIRLLQTFRAGHDTPTYVHMHLGSGRLWGQGVWGTGVWGGTGPVYHMLVGEPHWVQRNLA